MTARWTELARAHVRRAREAEAAARQGIGKDPQMPNDQTRNELVTEQGGGTLPTWLYRATAGHHDFIVYDESTGRDVALVRDFNEAHAKLIAAAPEMRAQLTALVDAYERSELSTDDPGYYLTARAIQQTRQLLARIDGKD